MSKSHKQGPALRVAKIRAHTSDGVVALSTGYHARVRPVAAGLIDQVVASVPLPKVPVVFVEEKQRNEPNPLDPDYIEALANAEQERTAAVIDAFIMFGYEITDMPDVSEWLPKLKMLERMKRLDLTQYDLNDELDRAYLFKRYIAVASADFALVSRRSEIAVEEIAAAEATFQRDAARAADTGQQPTE